MPTEKSFVHLHVHTEYSLLDGAARLDPLFAKVAEEGMPALAMTDHGNVFGAHDFWKTGKKHGVKAIIGLEAYVTPKTHRSDRTKVKWGSGGEDDVSGAGAYTHMTLLAETTEGMSNLFRLSSRASLEGMYYKPRVDRELLNAHGKGIIATTGCPSGEIQTYLRLGKYEEARASAAEFRDIFGANNFFVELMDHGLDIERRATDGLLRLSKDLNLPLLATNDLHYVNQTDHAMHDALLCINSGSNMDDPKRFKFDAQDFYVKSAEEMRRLWSQYPEACDNTLLIADRCNVEFNEDANLMPAFPVPDGETEDSWFTKEVQRGLEDRYKGVIPADRQKQADYEVKVILDMGFPGYFLVTADLIKWAKAQGIRVGPGRGSAAGALVAYALRITDLDPVTHKLLFERFLNPERVSMPDIDIDFDDRRRSEVIEYVTRKYGADKVAQLVTFGRIKAKAAVKDSARILGYPYGMGDKITKAMPPGVMGKDIPLSGIFDPSHKRYGEAAEFRALYDGDAEVRRVVDVAKTIEGLIRSTGVHAAGVILSREPLMDNIPIMKREADGAIITQFEQKSAEALGLLKMDFLGLRNLTIIDDALKSIQANRGITVDLDVLSETLDDPKTYELVARGDTLGVFQLDGGPMRNLLKSMRPDHFEDISAVLALYRPGPMGANAHNDYADRKNKRKPVVPIHPELAAPLKDILGDTYGLIVYQEQVMAIAQQLAGYTLGNADLLRRAMGKKDAAILAKEYEPFRDGMIGNGYSDAAIQTLWEILVPFSDYAFNKCVDGDTVVSLGASGSGSDGTVTVGDLYNRLHVNLLPPRRRGSPPMPEGPCLHCKREDRPAVWRGRCKACKSWWIKFRNSGLTALSLGADGRVRPRRIKDVHHNGVRDCFEITLADGRSITATANHRHMTPDGWRRVDELAVGQMLLTVGEEQRSVHEKYDYRLCAERANYASAHLPTSERNGENSLGFVNGASVALDTWTASQEWACQAAGCTKSRLNGSRIERAHLDGDRKNNAETNLRMLCASHHKQWDYKNNKRVRRWEAGKPAVPVAITSITNVGLRDVYDLEMEAGDADTDGHERSWVGNGILTHNSHTAAYGLVSYDTAYLKANFPAEYMAALLTSVQDDKDKSAIYLNECRRMGIKVLAPDVNESSLNYTPVGDDIRVGLVAIRNVGVNVVEAIIRARSSKGNFLDFTDFLDKIEPVACTKKVADSLIKAGAFDSLGLVRRALQIVAEGAVEQYAAIKKNEANGQDSLFGSYADGGEDLGGGTVVTVPDIEEWDKSTLLAFERDMLGLYVSDHPLSDVGDRLTQNASASIVKIIESGRSEQEVTIGGLVTDVKKKMTKKGDVWAIVTLEDLTGSVEALVFPQTYSSVEYLLVRDSILLMKGTLDRRDDGMSLKVQDIRVPDLATAPDERPIPLTVPKHKVTAQVVADLKRALLGHPGKAPVHLHMTSPTEETIVVCLADDLKIKPSPNLTSELKAVLGPNCFGGERSEPAAAPPRRRF